ncbi:MAG: hypothetical protein CO096_05025 [Armatimonadetes bacterium CG_4_9_14_3_um_filter_66_14]|nr:MAG: hypothetical protein CO096_05025 [Armatimonadetes bacterium CG_4_9_14_3_um_filter_66_14]
MIRRLTLLTFFALVLLPLGMRRAHADVTGPCVDDPFSCEFYCTFEYDDQGNRIGCDVHEPPCTGGTPHCNNQAGPCVIKQGECPATPVACKVTFVIGDGPPTVECIDQDPVTYFFNYCDV